MALGGALSPREQPSFLQSTLEEQGQEDNRLPERPTVFTQI
jgi:hypothetical protein